MGSDTGSGGLAYLASATRLFAPALMRDVAVCESVGHGDDLGHVLTVMLNDLSPNLDQLPRRHLTSPVSS
jgi:hypothetical protein